MKATSQEVAFLFILADMALCKRHTFIATLLLLFFACAFRAKAQVPYALEKEFKNCLRRDFDEKGFLQFYQMLDSLERAGVNFSELKTYKVYSTHISKLLNSVNYYQKGIAYRLIASLKDKTFNTLLLERMEMEDNKFLKTLTAAAIMKLMPTQTTVAFDFLVDCDDFATSPLLPVYLAMNEKSIIKTGYTRLNDKRPRAKVFALQTIARFDTRKQVDSIIIKAIQDWDANIKGYAIIALGIHRQGNYKDILQPYLNEPQLKEVILETLENSYTEMDIHYAEELKRKWR